MLLLGEVRHLPAHQGDQIVGGHLHLIPHFSGGADHGVHQDHLFREVGGKGLGHPHRRAAPVDITGEGEQLLLGEHGDRFHPGGPGGLFQIQGLGHGDDIHEVFPLGALGNQGLEYLLHRLAQQAGGGDAVGDLALGQGNLIGGAGDARRL